MTKAEYRKLKKQLYDYEELLRKEKCEKEYLNMLPFKNKYFEAGNIYFKIINVEPQSYLLVSEENGAICECLTITDNSIKIENSSSSLKKPQTPKSTPGSVEKLISAFSSFANVKTALNSFTVIVIITLPFFLILLLYHRVDYLSTLF